MAAPAPAATGEPPSWFTYDRAPAFQTVKSMITVPMSSGGSLACDLTRPGVDPVAPAEGEFPTLVLGLVPYAALNLPGGDAVATALAPGGATADFFTQRGYNTLACDIRGTGRSVATTGERYTTWMSAKELQDNYDLIEWSAAQPWSDGNVGQYSGSYGGGTTQRIAGARPPHLTAVAPGFMVNGFGEAGPGYIYRGGAATQNLLVWSEVGCGVLGYGCDGPAVTQSFLEHPAYDEYWKQSDYTQTWDDVTIPVLSHGSTTDSAQLGGTFENYIGLRRAGKDVYLIAGPWGHAGAPASIILRWFDHWLLNLPEATLPPSRATVQEQGASTQGWYGIDDWPAPDARSVRLSLGSDGTLDAVAGPAGTAAYSVAPVSAMSGQSLTFDSAPLRRDAVLAGRPTVHLEAALDTTDTIFVAELFDVAPDGTATAIASPGYLKASHGRSQAAPTAVRPGSFQPYVVVTFDKLWRIVAGHRIRVELRASDSGLLEQAPAGTVTVRTGKKGSFLVLPLRGGL